jgi:uncharacterized protein YndB with AHSA1/START domain
MTSESHYGEVRLDGTGSVITFVRRLPVRPEVVWNALTAPDQLVGWLAAGDIEQRAGGAVLIDFGDGGKVTGAVLTCDPPHVLEYEWNFTGESGSVVRFDIAPDGDGSGSILTLVHRGLSGPIASGYGAGWHAHLDGLAALMTGDGFDWDARFLDVKAAYSA